MSIANLRIALEGIALMMMRELVLPFERQSSRNLLAAFQQKSAEHSSGSVLGGAVPLDELV